MKIISQSNNFIISYLFLAVLIVHSRPTPSQEVEKKEFDYSEESETGPKHWGKLHEEWAACNNGKLQSPIDLLNSRVQVVSKLDGRLTWSYKPSNAIIWNRGHDISLQWIGEGAGSVNINGTDYELQECHWHSPSEHIINGMRYDLEMHVVHLSSDHRIKVIGIMFRIGEPDPFLSELEEQISSITDSKHNITAGVVDPTHIKMGSRKYYRYLGSLTVPPCTEGVIWTMSTRVRTVSKEQVALLRKAVYDNAEKNARPLQSLNAREISLFDPTFLPVARP